MGEVRGARMGTLRFSFELCRNRVTEFQSLEYSESTGTSRPVRFSFFRAGLEGASPFHTLPPGYEFINQLIIHDEDRVGTVTSIRPKFFCLSAAAGSSSSLMLQERRESFDLICH